MASVSSVSSTSSLYNSANIISGLASGMDTESMIENLVQSYQTKIQNLTNQATIIGWKQDSYRSIISKLVAFTNNYTSYTSSTNLLSSSFFSSAVNVKAQGKYADLVTASGRTESDVKLVGVSQMATAARYVTSGGSALKADGGTTVTGDVTDFVDGTIELSHLSGSLSFKYGSQTVSISFNELTDKIVDPAEADGLSKAEQLKSMIESKLADQNVSFSNGTASAASDCIKVSVGSDGTISFTDKTSGGNSVSISSASDSIASVLGIGDTSDTDNPVTSFKVTDKTQFTYDKPNYEYASAKGMNINLDGETKSIYTPQITKNDDGSFTLTMPTTVKDQYGNTKNVYDTSTLDMSKYTVVKQGETQTVDKDELADAYTGMLSKSVSEAFGKKVTVTNEAAGTGDLQLKFEVAEGSTLLINTSGGEGLGIGNTATNYTNTSNTLEDLMNDDVWESLTPATDANGKELTDASGNTLYNFEINGVLIGQYSKDTKLSSIMSDINANTQAGVKVSYSTTTREFVFNSRETGSQNEINIEEGGLAAAIFGSTEISSEGSDGGSAAFGDAYGFSMLSPSDTVTIKVNDSSGDFTLELKGLSASDTVEEAAGRIDTLLGAFPGYSASYNKTSGQVELTDQDGKKLNFEMYIDDPDLGKIDLEFNEAYAPAASKTNYTPGQDAKFQVSVNGTIMNLTRGSNSAEIDGMTMKFTGTFNEDYNINDAVSFQTTTDSDKIVDAVKSMITDYNEMMSEIRKAYATMPYQDSNGVLQSYEPLSADDMATMSESAIQAYEAKAKQGILFGDSNLRSLYESLRSVFQPTGSDAALLSKIGISVSFDSENATSITLDENKLREALESDPDEVANLFTRTAVSGVSTSGIMQGMKNTLDRYAGLTGSVKGILVQQAGTPLNSLSLLDNQWQKQLDSLSSQIETWQDRLTSQVDRYTSMFSKLEVLINQMNSQSSTLASMMGG